ncbi:hypothetical protein [Planobispora longispora]|uniref:Peptidase M11 gametolysin domain-containing protein n=1 Tax=Planobispora longispora TaxID=28887 RepID=A0A8J3RWP5_9ACTN|nr:hypothetical protein [Planobispora longispora]BFE88687.1 hypothetical protein GCM10020093_112880 [Planobispora longispora]GIH81531.1 hypothetical protein Plo01_79600 [Planobispora longispora]
MKRRMPTGWIPPMAAALAVLSPAVLPSAAQAAQAAPEVRTTAVVLIDFQDKGHPDKAAATAKAKEVFFGSGTSVATYFRKSSQDRVAFSGEVFGPWKLDMKAGCDTGRMRTEVDEQMKARGIDRARFKHVSIIMPSGGCGWAGLATVGGGTSWMPDGYSAAGTIHEIGHNLGLSHEGTSACTEGTLSNCASAGYRGKSSVMGGGGPGVGLSAPALVKLKWHTAAERIVPTASGTYTLTPLYGPGRRFLDIPLQDGTDRLVVEHRKRGHGPEVDVAEGVIVYLVPKGDYKKAIQIDATPATTAKGSTTLAAGKSIKDRGVTLTVLSESATGAKVSLVLPGGAPAPSPTAKPSSPAPSPTVKPSSPAPSPTVKPSSPAPNPADGGLSAISVGVGVKPGVVAPGQKVAVTAVCSGSRVAKVVSTAFATRQNVPDVPTVAWYPSITVSAKARAGRHSVYVFCGGGSAARTSVTVG